MRLVTYTGDAGVRVGAVVGDEVVDLAAAAATLGAELPTSMRGLLAADRSVVLDAAGVEDPSVRRPLAGVELHAPVPDPGKIICVGRNYADHAAEVGAERPERAIFFTRFAQTLVDPGAPVWLPRVSAELDWEGELAVVIGTRCRHVSRSDAYSVVAGYSAFNDVSVRDFQRRTPQYTAGKNFDATAPFGPWLVTPDEIGDPHDLELETFVGDERVQHGSTADMIFDIPELIADITQWTTLEPGDVIATGTPAGVGGTRTPPRYLTSGDVVTVRIARIGELRSPVIDEPPLS